jgi:putative endopeptidase
MKSGLDLSHIDQGIRPQDDLFRFMNGKWLKESTIPADRASDGAFYWLYEQAEKQVKQIILDQAASKAATGSNAQKIGDLYNSFMDEAGIEKLGLSPIADDLAKAAGIKTVDDFLKTLGEFEARGLSGLFYTYVSTDNKDSTKNIVYLGQSGLSLPDEAYYREDEYKEIRQAFLKHVQTMFELANLENPSQSAAQVLEIETQLAAYHWDQVKDRDAELTYNKKSFTELKQLAASFNWPLWIQSSNTPAKVLDQVIIRQPSYLEGLSKLLAAFDLPKWRSWLSWHVLSGASPYLSAGLCE